MQQGFINVMKPKNVSSAFVVSKLKKHFNISHVGHMGTLDPLASGVLPIAIGKATRMFDYFTNKIKKYVANFEFGYETDTLDVTGVITKQSKNLPKIYDIENVLSKLIGEQMQMPPIYSAKKINGKNAYELARAGKVVNLKACKITIYDLKCISQINENTFQFEITCSGGTYVRSIGRDIASLLNTYATMSDLVRTKNGSFEIENSVTLDNVLNETNLLNILEPIEKIFNYFRVIEITDKEFLKIRNGVSVPCEEFNDEIFIMYQKNLVGVGVCEEKLLRLKTYLLNDEKENL